jgi:7,8-dihydroneopterin aldolase/epimerase/oxygenase
MQHIIEVNGIKCYGHHGCLPEETAIGGHYLVDVKMHTNFSLAALEDDLSQTIDYVKVNAVVVEEMSIPSKLIEHVGQRIVNRLKQDLRTIEILRVKIIKLSPPINGDVDNVAIIIEE